MRRGPYKPLVQDDEDEDDEGINENIFLLKQPEDINSSKPLISSVKSKKPIDLSPDVNFGGIELRSRNSKNFVDKTGNLWRDGSPNNSIDNIIFIERKIQKSDSLRNLALQYGISVAELKRANGLMSDQEFYGKDILKIPVIKYGLHHSQSVQPQAASSNSNVDLLGDLSFDSQFVDLNIHEHPPPTAESRSHSSDRENMPPKLFLKSVDDSVMKVKTAQQELVERQNLSNDPALLDDSIETMGVAIASRPVKSTWLQRNISHFVVVVLVIFVIIIVPVCVILYKFFAAVTKEDGDITSSN